MTSTRLNADIRQALHDDLLGYRFKDTVADLRRDWALLAEAVYNDIYPSDVQARMQSLPKGWLPTQTYVQVQFATSTVQLTFTGNKRQYGYSLSDDEKRAFAIVYPPQVDAVLHLFPEHQSNGATVKLYEAREPLATRYELLSRRHADFVNDLKAAHKATAQAVKGATTIEALIAAWPEVEPFAKKYLGVQPASRQLPVVQRDVLNKQLGLPVPTEPVQISA